jgi:hypothetical protein
LGFAFVGWAGKQALVLSENRDYNESIMEKE